MVGRVARGQCRLIDHGERHDEKPEERDTEKKERPHLSSRMQYNRGLMCPALISRSSITTGGSCAPP